MSAPGSSPALLLIEGLRRAGWIFAHIRDEAGELTEIRALFAWPSGWTDGLIVYGETEAEAVRCDPGRAVVFYREGTVLDTISALLNLPKPGDQYAPPLNNYALWTPGAR